MRHFFLILCIGLFSACSSCAQADADARDVELQRLMVSALLPSQASSVDGSNLEAALFTHYRALGKAAVVKAKLAEQVAAVYPQKDWAAGFEVLNHSVRIYIQTDIKDNPRRRFAIFFYFDSDGNLTKCVRGMSYDSK